MHMRGLEQYLVERTCPVIGTGGGCPIVGQHIPLPPTVMCAWEPKECLRGSKGMRKHQSPISACILQMLVPRSPWPALLPRNPPQAQVFQAPC